MPRDDDDYDNYNERNPERDRYDAVLEAREKVFPPALALMIAAALGMVGGIGLTIFGVFFSAFMSDFADQIEKQQQAAIQKQQQQAIQAGGPGAVPPPPVAQPPINMKSFFTIYGAFYAGWGVFLTVKSAIILYGAYRMKSLRGYGWAMTSCILGIASVLTCNLLALGFGIWGLVVLMDPVVKEGFEREAGRDYTPRRRGPTDDGDDV